MSTQSFRFLHAASFHLESPLRGMTDASEELVELLAEVPLTSAQAVFEAAIREEVDFLMLSGDILDPMTAGPRAVTFLQQQFETLEDRDISVYWSASRTDQNGGWIRSFDWPANVRIFAADEVQRVTHCRGDLPVAEIFGRSWHPQNTFRAAEFVADVVEACQIVVACERMDLEGHGHAATYWALGGSNSPSTPLRSSSVAHCPGSPLGFQPSESGPHGCTLVHVDAEGNVRNRMIATDAVRWCHERIKVGPGMTRHELRQSIKNRVTHLQSDAGRPLLVDWMLSGESRFDSIFVEPEEQQETLVWLRGEFSLGAPMLWSTSVRMESPDELPPDWCEEDSILGDYLRVVQRYEGEIKVELNLGDYTEGQPPRELAELLVLDNKLVRDTVLREAAILGADLLRGDESPATIDAKRT